MQMKKKLATAVIAVALFVGATAPVSATSSICDVPSSSFDIWFYKTFIARC